MNIFIDCGFYVGNALKIYQDAGIVDDTWMIYAFEPNPNIPVPAFVVRAAAWTEDGEVGFKIQGREDAARVDPEAELEVRAIDLSKFVADLPEDDYIICSMDIEGAEFPVLRKMLKDHTIDRINILDIEFHHRLMLEETPEDAEKLINEIEARGVKVKLKVSLT